MHGHRRRPRGGFVIYQEDPPTVDESANMGIFLGLIISAVGWFGKKTEAKWIGGLMLGVSAGVKYWLSTQQPVNKRRSRWHRIPAGGRPVEYMPKIDE